MKLSAAIMAHPKRRHFVEELQADQLAGVPVVWDREGSRWETGARSLLAYDKSATHHVVVQDDAVLCRDFIATCEAAAEGAGEKPACLYIGRVRPHYRIVSPALLYVRDHGGAWLIMEGPWWGVAVIVPTSYIEELVRWGNIHQHIVNYDKRMARWFSINKIDCLYSVPSIVDHRPVDENPSLVPRRTGNRRAQWFIGADQNGLDINWKAPPIPLKARFENKRGRAVQAYVGGVSFERMMRAKDWVLVT